MDSTTISPVILARYVEAYEDTTTKYLSEGYDIEHAHYLSVLALVTVSGRMGYVAALEDAADAALEDGDARVSDWLKECAVASEERFGGSK